MSPLTILGRSLEYKNIIEKRCGIVLTDHERRLINGLIDYLCACAQLEEQSCPSSACDSAIHTQAMLDEADISDIQHDEQMDARAEAAQ